MKSLTVHILLYREMDHHVAHCLEFWSLREEPRKKLRLPDILSDVDCNLVAV